MVTRLVGDEEGKGEGGKGNVDGDEGGGRRGIGSMDPPNLLQVTSSEEVGQGRFGLVSYKLLI